MADQAAADFLESRGIYATPVLQVGDALLVGFDPGKVDRLLRRPPA
jgi:hypothetical protein